MSYYEQAVARFIPSSASNEKLLECLKQANTWLAHGVYNYESLVEWIKSFPKPTDVDELDSWFDTYNEVKDILKDVVTDYVDFYDKRDEEAFNNSHCN